MDVHVQIYSLKSVGLIILEAKLTVILMQYLNTLIDVSKNCLLLSRPSFEVCECDITLAHTQKGKMVLQSAMSAHLIWLNYLQYNKEA